MKYLEKIINFKYDNLRDHLNGDSMQENNYFEWKGCFKLENDRLKKLFSAFANANGGYIFFGIGNNKELKLVELGDGVNLLT